MPLPGERAAPEFDESKPRELKRYFRLVAQLLARAGITDEQAKKEHTVDYLSVEVSDLWQAQPTFENGTWTEFKDAIGKLYPGSDNTNRYVLRDLTDIITEAQHSGIRNRADFGTFMRKLLACTDWLKASGSLSENESRRAFMDMLPEKLRTDVIDRLRIKSPNTPYDIPYPIPDVIEACEWFLQGVGSAATNPGVLGGASDQSRYRSTTPVVHNASSANAGMIKQEDLMPLIHMAIQQTIQRVQGPQNTGVPLSSLPHSAVHQPPPHIHVHNEQTPHPPSLTNNPRSCFFCGDLYHIIRDCILRAQYLKEGKCIQNAEGQMVCPGGSQPPFVRGGNLKERIDEWHRQNPGQLAKASLMLNIVGISRPPSNAAGSQQQAQTSQGSSSRTASSLKLQQLEDTLTTSLKDLRDAQQKLRKRLDSRKPQAAETSQFLASDYPRPSRPPSIPNSRVANSRDVPPHMSTLSFVSGTGSSATIEDITDEEIEELARETFIANVAQSERPVEEIPVEAFNASSSRTRHAKRAQAEKPLPKRPVSETEANTAANRQTRSIPEVVIETRSKPKRSVRITTPESEEESDNPEDDRLLEEDSIPDSAASPTVDPVPEARTVEHPFANARDAIYAPPVLPNVAALPKPSRTKGESSYRNVVPVMANNPLISQEIFNRSIKGKIELTQEELMAVAPSIRNYYREAVSTKRIPTERVPEREITKVFAMQEPFDDGSSISVDWNVDDFKEQDRHPDIVSSFMHQQSPPPGTRVAPDPYEQYLKELPADAELPMAYTVVADESVILRTVWPVIENHSAVECVVDPGCQIVAMSEAIAERVGLQYDPTVILHMQSANGSMNDSLGMARDVAFRFGDITVYLQVHILRNPAYDVLLGRPFDTLTESVVKNFRNSSTSITITCPNTGRKSTIPTRERGAMTRVERPAFQKSRM